VVLTAAQLSTLTPPAAITGFATSAIQTDGTQKSQIVDSGGEAVTVTGGKLDVNATVELDPSGLATEAKQDAEITLLTTIESNQLPDGHNVTVDNASLAVTGTFWQATQPVSGTVTANLGTLNGAATTAKQDTIIGHLDGVESLLTDIEADTDTLAVTGGGAESGALRVTVANDSTGVLSVDDNGASLTVDNAGLTELAAAINSDKVDVNIASSGIALGGTSAADDADFTAGTTPGTPAMGVYESTPTTVTDGDLGTVGITAGRRLKTSSTIDAALPAGTNNIGDVDVLSSALPDGASTSAKQDTIIGHLDGVEGLLTTIDGDTGNISTKIDTVAGAVSGSEMQVDVVSSALPSGAAIAANQQTDALTDTELRAADVKITLDGETVPVTGTFWQATQPVSGTVTANAGTNLNTSALALETGGNLAAAATSLATLDNIVSGSEAQVDIVAALPAGTNAIGKLTQPATPTLANITMTGSSVTLQASNTARRNLMVFNDSGVTVYVKLGSSASSTSFTVKLVDQAYYELPDPVYTGIVTALGASGDVRVTEVV
jgi:hypothetical protein